MFCQDKSYADNITKPPIDKDMPTEQQQFLEEIYENFNNIEIVTVGPDGNRQGEYGDIVGWSSSANIYLYFQDSASQATSWTREGTKIGITTSFVDRGDPAGVDYNETGSKAVLNTDGTWRDLDLSAIVPDGAEAILFAVKVLDDAVNSQFGFRRNGNSNTTNVSKMRTQVANVINDGTLISFCDENRVVEYFGSDLAFAGIEVTVMGWWE